MWSSYISFLNIEFLLSFEDYAPLWWGLALVGAFSWLFLMVIIEDPQELKMPKDVQKGLIIVGTCVAAAVWPVTVCVAGLVVGSIILWNFGYGVWNLGKTARATFIWSRNWIRYRKDDLIPKAKAKINKGI